MSAIVTYPDTENRHADTSKITLDKILQALNGGAGGGAGTYSGGGNFSGTGSPEGVVTANKGATYTATDTQQFYFKTTDGTNTGWVG